MTAKDHINKHLLGALSNYVSLGEIPDYQYPGTQGHEQYNALLDEIKNRGQLNTVPLYRGSFTSPHDDASNPERPAFTSLTSNKQVAEEFASRREGRKVYTIPPKTVRTISVNSYDFALPDQHDTYGFKQYPWESEHLAHLDDFK